MAALVVPVLLAAGVGLGPQRAAADVGDDWGEIVPGEYLVRLEPGTDPATVAAAVGATAVPEALSAGDDLHRFLLDPTVPAPTGVARLLQAAGVGDAQPNIAADVAEFFGTRRLFWTDQEGPVPAPASAFTARQPALSSTGPTASTTGGLPALAATGRGVVVAVLDTGIDRDHPSLARWIAPGGRDFVDRDAVPEEVADGIDQNGNGEVDEAYGHGTYVAGIVRLVAPHARILPVRIIDSDGRTDAWRILQGVHHAAARGAKVVNLSLGGLGLGKLALERLETWSKQGVVLVAAAGNEGTSEARFPAAAPGVLAVTAIDGRTGRAATFANHGSWVDVAAPGVRVVSTFADGGYATWGGTSAAAPVVAGGAALVAQSMGTGAATDDLVDRITATARPEPVAGLTAYGRVDLASAVQRAAQG